MRKLLFLLLVASAAAQTIAAAPAKPEGKAVSLTLAYENSDPEYHANQCLWYLVNPERRAAQRVTLLHTGCESWSRDFEEGRQETLALVTNGFTDKYPHLSDQRSDAITVNVQPRVDIKKHSFQ